MSSELGHKRGEKVERGEGSWEEEIGGTEAECSHWTSRTGLRPDKRSLWLVLGFSCHSFLLWPGSSSAGWRHWWMAQRSWGIWNKLGLHYSHPEAGDGWGPAFTAKLIGNTQRHPRKYIILPDFGVIWLFFFLIVEHYTARDKKHGKSLKSNKSVWLQSKNNIHREVWFGFRFY